LRESGSLLPFTIGVVIASAIWHSMLALLAGTLGRRMAESGLHRLIRIPNATLRIAGVVLLA
jgi:arginine exporter protein ArgO